MELEPGYKENKQTYSGFLSQLIKIIMAQRSINESWLNCCATQRYKLSVNPLGISELT